MIILFLVIAIISALLLILVVMVQDEQGEGLGGIFGGGSSSPFGSRSGNVLTRITAILSVVFIVCTLVLAWLNKTSLTDSTVNAAREDRFQSGTDAGWYTKVQGAPAEAGEGNSLYNTDSGAATPDEAAAGSDDTTTVDQPIAESESTPPVEDTAGIP